MKKESKITDLNDLKYKNYNLTVEKLYKITAKKKEGYLSPTGAYIVYTGKHTSRAARDKYIVEGAGDEFVYYNEYNQKISEEIFWNLFHKMNKYARSKELFIQYCFAGQEDNFIIPIRVTTEYAWHSIFVRNMFTTKTNGSDRSDQFKLFVFPNFFAEPEKDGTRSETFIIINLKERIVLIGGTAYAGEIKKSVFTIMNYLLPQKGILPMHCAANMGNDSGTALFFGLSGTGKTSLSADPERLLIGDDEHGWHEEGIFNFENGCYAKIFKINKDNEPHIYQCINRFGTILENVDYNASTGEIDLNSDRITENSRASYPLHFIKNAKLDRKAPHPNHIIFLTCDAYGVMPPVAKLDMNQMVYHFISGYTSKIGGTEEGQSKKPIPTFSACFGAPFMVMHPLKYAIMLKEKVEKYKSKVWLVNTGWVGGPYGIGNRISIKYTREILKNILNGKLDKVKFLTDPIFRYKIPTECGNIPKDILFPEYSWGNRDKYLISYKELASYFVENMKKFGDSIPSDILKGGPQI